MLKPVVLSMFILLPCLPLNQESFHSVPGRISPSIVWIESDDNAGTGFVARDDGTIVTALGTIDGAAHVRVTTEHGDVYDNVSLLVKDQRRGIAIIRVPIFGMPEIRFGDSNNLEEQQILMVRRSSARHAKGLITQVSRILGVGYSDQGHKVVSITGSIPSEALGGPIVDTEGRVIAVAVSQEDQRFAVPINDVRGLLDYAEHNKPIVQWGSERDAESPWSRFVVYWRRFLMNTYYYYPWLIAFLITGFVIYLVIYLLYWHWARKAKRHPCLAAVWVSGKRYADLSARDVATEISLHRSRLAEITTRQQKDIDETQIAKLSAPDFPVEIITRLVEAPDDINPPPLKPLALELPDETQIGLFTIPIKFLVTLGKALFGWIPVRSREQYRNALVHVSLVSVGSEACLRVWRGRQYLSSSVRIDSEASNVGANQTTTCGGTADLTLFRNAVFMILELTQDEALPGRNWLGKKYFADGLEYLDRCLRTHQLESMEKARKKATDSFCLAAEVDNENYEALYINGLILGAKRTGDSNELARELLNRAVNTKKKNLQALVHAGLANCYAQQHFRLGKKKAEVIEEAQRHIKDAYASWKEAEWKPPHAWIRAADAFVQVLQAMSKEDEGGESIGFYRKAAKLYFQAIELEKKNSAYLNALGFVLLRVTEQGYTELDLGIPSNNLNVPQQSEHYLRRSQELDPSNKLAYANLCLLYATTWYREEDPKKYLKLSRDHGLKAVELDPKYVHGFRDLAKSLLRYKQIKEARLNFETAMDLAGDSDKKKEIKKELESVLGELDKESQEAWRDSAG